MKAKLLYQRAISQWGHEAQIRMALEECIELSHAITKWMRRCGKTEIEQVEEEIADVEVMMAQLRFIFDPKRINRWKAKKIKRLQRRLEQW